MQYVLAARVYCGPCLLVAYKTLVRGKGPCPCQQGPPIACEPTEGADGVVVDKMTDPLSEKNTLGAHPLPGPSSNRRVHSTAGSCVLSGKMTWPHRPAACAMACTILGCSWAFTPCTQKRVPHTRMQTSMQTSGGKPVCSALPAQRVSTIWLTVPILKDCSVILVSCQDRVAYRDAAMKLHQVT